MPAATVWDLLLARASDRTLPQSLILVHPDSEAGLEKGRELIRLFLCTEDRRPDCACRDCRLFASGNHPDAITVLPEGKMSYKVEQIRDLRLEAQKPPFMGEGKFFLLGPAHKLNPSSANALLKILEEPTPTTHFLLLTSQPFLLLPTIRSRCFQVTLPVTEVPSEPDEELEALWRDLAQEDAPAVRMRFLRAVSQLDYPEIPRTLLKLWCRQPNPALADLAFDYMNVLASTPATFNRQQALESLWRKGGPA